MVARLAAWWWLMRWAERERVAVGFGHAHPGPPAAALLVSHADGAVERGPGVAVGRREQVVGLAGEVEPVVLIEHLPVVVADDVLHLPLPGRDVLVERLGGGREVVGIVDAHLVEVGVHLGQPLRVEGNALAALLLGLPGPVAVQVEVVVVEAPARPGLVVLPGVERGVGRLTGHAVVPVHVAVVAVGVHAGVDEHHRTLQPLLQLLVGGVGQVVEHPHHRLRRHRLVAVHVVAQPHDGRLRARRGRPALQAREAQVVAADVVQPCQVLGRGNLHDFQRPVLVSAAVALHRHAAGRVRHHVVDVAQHLGLGREAAAQLVAQKLRWRQQRAGGGRRRLGRGGQSAQ